MRALGTLGLLISLVGLAAPVRAEGGGLLADFLSKGASTDLESVLASLPEDAVVLRTDFDVTGDGIPEVFLAQADSYTRFSGYEWRVYELGEGAAFRYLGAVSFQEQSVRVVQPFVLHVLQYPGNGKAWRIEYRFTGTAIEAVDLVEGLETDDTIAEEQRAVTRFWREDGPPRARAEVSPRGLGPWRDAGHDQVVHGLRSIVGEDHRVDALGGSQRSGTLFGHLKEHRPCPLHGCEVYLELADLLESGGQVLLNTSQFAGYPRLVYTRDGKGWRYLGELPPGAYRVDPGGRVSVLDTRGRRVLHFDLSAGEVTLEGEVAASANPVEWKSERAAILASLADDPRRERLYRVAWEALVEQPANPPWLTFETREPAGVEVDLSLPVVNVETGGES